MIHKKILFGLCACILIATQTVAQHKKNKLKTASTTSEVIVQEQESTKAEKKELSISEEDKERISKTKTIFVKTNVFVQLVFASNIQNARSGAPEAMVLQKEDNVVFIQSLQEGVDTNISIKTADGLYYSYKIVSEDLQEIPLFYEIPISDAVNGKTKLIEDQKKQIVAKMSTQEVAQTIYGYNGFIKNRNTATYRNIYLHINGIYIDKGNLFFLLKLENKSNLDYKIEHFQFATMPLKKSKKRIESEERKYTPLFFYKPLKEIKANSSQVLVAVFEQFTLNDQKKLEITMGEEAGERTVRLEIDSKKIVEARNIQ